MVVGGPVVFFNAVVEDQGMGRGASPGVAAAAPGERFDRSI